MASGRANPQQCTSFSRRLRRRLVVQMRRRQHVPAGMLLNETGLLQAAVYFSGLAIIHLWQTKTKERLEVGLITV